MYNRVHLDQKKCHMSKSYNPGMINFPKRHYENIFPDKIVNKLHAWIENLPHGPHPPNIKD